MAGTALITRHHLGAPHSPDLFHVQHALSQAVCAPLASQERAASQVLTEAKDPLDQGQARLENAGDPPAKCGPGRPPKAPMSLAQAQVALKTARREQEPLAQQREPVRQSIQAIGQAYHFVDLERGVRRNGYLSLRNHQLRGLDRPRKRACLTTIHNFFLTRPDGTTAAAWFFGQKPRSLFAAILDSVDLPPAPRSPQRIS